MLSKQTILKLQKSLDLVVYSLLTFLAVTAFSTIAYGFYRLVLSIINYAS